MNTSHTCTSLILAILLGGSHDAAAADQRPNILFAISDDQSYPHASAYGNASTTTPAFDRVARQGVLCNNAFVTYPSCSPSRASLLTGRYPWQIEHAGNFSSTFGPKYIVYPDVLEDAGYCVGYTGKGWGPGDWRGTGRLRNPAGMEYNRFQMPSPEGINSNNYARNFKHFLTRRPKGKPFVFWFGSTEPHRRYQDGIGRQRGKQLADADVPEFLPNTPVVQSDMLDYSVEIEWFDSHLGRMLQTLEAMGELDNTLVVVTSDNGMPFPRAKANVYEFGIHVPMALMWQKHIPGGRVIEDMISFVDLAPTFLDAAGVQHPGPHPMAGASLLGILKSGRQGLVDRSRTAVLASRERHASARYKNFGYPQRVIRTHDYLYLRNYEPDYWPAGQPRAYDFDGTLGPRHGAYDDIDASPSKSLLIKGRDDPAITPFFDMAVGKRPEEELYDVREDPGCVRNLAEDPEFAAIRQELRNRLESSLADKGDSRIVADGHVFRTYRRVVRGNRFPDPNDPGPPLAEAIVPPIRERHGGELPPGSRIDVDVTIEVMAGDEDCVDARVSLPVPEVMLGHSGFTLTRMDTEERVEMRLYSADETAKHVLWQVSGRLHAGTTRRYRLSPTADETRVLETDLRPEDVLQKDNTAPWVTIIHGR
jgi:N-sulfoglucosamine sulfohydrolase